MNQLLVDAGNSRLKWALRVDGQLQTGSALSYDWPNFAAQLADQWQDLPRRLGDADKLLLANVAGDRVAQGIADWVKENTPLTIENVQTQAAAFGVRCAYADPAQMGADRWAALVAARHLVVGASCIIDCGTALTIDVLRSDGLHGGGVIVPGLAMMRESLSAKSARIEPGASTVTSLFAVKTTQDAVGLGALAAAAGAVEEVLAQAEQAWGRRPTCIVTGGDAKALMTVLRTACRHEPDWVLKGLAVMAMEDAAIAPPRNGPPNR